MTKASRKDEIVLEKVLCIYYPLCFCKDIIEVKVLLDSDSKINAITSAYAAKIGLKIRPTNFKAQKINDFTLDRFKIVLANFQIKDKLGRTRYFQEMFLLASTGIEVVLEMFFLNFNNTNVSFLKWKLI